MSARAATSRSRRWTRWWPQAEEIVLTQEGVRDVFAFAGDGGLNNNTGGVSAPGDTIGQIQIDLEPWGHGPTAT
jgi:multidrug efflux pump